MALIQCEECSQLISERARTCAQCGYPRRPPPWTHRAFKVLVGLAAAIFVGLFVLSMIMAWVARKPFELDLRDIEPRTTLQLQDAPGRLG